MAIEPAVSAAALIFPLASDQGWIARALSLRWMVTLGEISYAVYLFQMPLLLFYWIAIPPSAVPQWAQLSIFVCALFTVSFMVRYFIEVPTRGAIRALARNRASIAWAAELI